MIATVSRVWCIGSKRSSAARVYHIPDVNRPTSHRARSRHETAAEAFNKTLREFGHLSGIRYDSDSGAAGSVGFEATAKGNRLARVHHSDQGKTQRRGGRAGLPAVARLADRAEPPGVPRSAADRDRAADDVPRHVMQITIGRQPHREPLLAADHVERAHDADRILLAAGRRAERAEVMAAAKGRECLPHRGDVE